MQGYKVPEEELPFLGTQFQDLPEGWSYDVVTVTEDLIFNLTPAAPIPSIQDEFDQVYIRIPGENTTGNETTTSGGVVKDGSTLCLAVVGLAFGTWFMM